MTKNNEGSSTASYEAIEKLVALKEKWALTQEEFDSEKKKILGWQQNTETKIKTDKAETPQILKNALRFGVTILFFSALIGGWSGYWSLIWILLPLWYIRWAPNKKYSHKFFEKFTHRKLYLWRILLSILFVFIALPIAIDSLKFKAQATKFEQEKANTPIPTITITSEIPEVVSWNQYVLTFDVVNWDIVKVDNQNPEKVSENSYKTNITLDTPSKGVTISARNKHHVQNQNVVVKRQPTPEEQEVIKEEEKQKQAQAEKEKNKLEEQEKQKADVIGIIESTVSKFGKFEVSVWKGEDFAKAWDKPPYEVIVNTGPWDISSCFNAKSKLFSIMKELYTNPSLSGKISRVRFSARWKLQSSLWANDIWFNWDISWPSNFWDVALQYKPYEDESGPLESRTWAKQIDKECD